MAESVLMMYLGNERFPSLEYFARKKILQNLDEIAPSSKISLLIDNTTLQSKIRRMERDSEKFQLRLRRRRNRIRESLHEIQYVSHKMIEIADAIQSLNLHYAESELRTLSNLNSCETTLQSCLSVIEVIFQLLFQNLTNNHPSEFAVTISVFVGEESDCFKHGILKVLCLHTVIVFSSSFFVRHV